MSKHKYREASMAKRQDIDRALSRGYALSPEPRPLTDEQTLEIDHAYNAYKADPSIREHKAHQDEVQMMRVLRGAIG